MSEKNLSRRGFTLGVAGATGGLVINRLSVPAFAEQLGNSNHELHQAKIALEDTSQHVARHIGKRFAKIAKITGEPTPELLGTMLTLTGPVDEELPLVEFVYYDDVDEFEVFEGKGHRSGRHLGVAGRFRLPDSDNLIHGKIATNRASEVTAEDARDLLVSADYRLLRASFTNRRSPVEHVISYGHGGAPVYNDAQGDSYFNVHPASAAELNNFAASIRRIDDSPALSLSTPGSI